MIGIAKQDMGFPNVRLKPFGTDHKKENGAVIITKGSLWVLPPDYDVKNKNSMFDEYKKKDK